MSKSVQVLVTFAMSLVATSTVAGQSNSTTMLKCIKELELPEYPIIARGARIAGTVEATFVVTESGKAGELQLSPASELLRRAVRETMERARFDSDCKGLSLKLSFTFRIIGTPELRPKDQYLLRGPGEIVILTRPNVPME